MCLREFFRAFSSRYVLSSRRARPARTEICLLASTILRCLKAGARLSSMLSRSFPLIGPNGRGELFCGGIPYCLREKGLGQIFLLLLICFFGQPLASKRTAHGLSRLMCIPWRHDGMRSEVNGTL